MPPGDYDLAGFCVGAVERDKVLTGAEHRSRRHHPRPRQLGRSQQRLQPRPANNRAASVGTSREILPEQGGQTLGEALLEPTRIYVRALLPLVQQRKIKGLAHITGGGLLENIPRVLPDGCHADIESNWWQLPSIFEQLQRGGDIAAEEMARTFNCGIGMAVIVSEDDKQHVASIARERGRDGFRDWSGRIGPARLHRAGSATIGAQPGIGPRRTMRDPKRVGILISGRGSNMRALVEKGRGYEVVLVASNKPHAAGLDWARLNGHSDLDVGQQGRRQGGIRPNAERGASMTITSGRSRSPGSCAS